MKLRSNKRMLQSVLILVGIGILGTLLFSFLSRWEANRSIVDEESDPYTDYGRPVVFYNGASYALRKNLETILLIGVDKYEADIGQESYNSTQQADSLWLVILDHTDKTYTVLQLNRDTMTNIPMLGVRGEQAGSFTGQLALAHTYGSGGRDSCRNTVEAVSGLLYGIGIDHYASFTMDAVALINDLSGGVQLTMQEDFSSFDSTMKKGAVVTLKGEQALTYVRTRKGLEDSTNLSRMERQRQYLNALQLNVLACIKRDNTFVLNLITKVSKYMVTDCTIDQMSKLFNETEAYQSSGIIAPEGKAVKGEKYMEFYVDEEALKSLVITSFYEPYSEESPT